MGDLWTIALQAERPSLEIVRLGLDERIPEIRAMRGVAQDHRWHPEGDVLAHSLIASDAAVALLADRSDLPIRREVVVLAALLHDVGKPATSQLIDGRWTAHGHAEHGAVLVGSLGVRLRWSTRLSRAVQVLVGTHMAVTSVGGTPSDRAVRRLAKRLEVAGSTLIEWAVVVEADGAARGEASVRGRSDPWLRLAGLPTLT